MRPKDEANRKSDNSFENGRLYGHHEFSELLLKYLEMTNPELVEPIKNAIQAVRI